MKLLIITISILLLGGCNSQKKEKGIILDKDKMQAVLWDVIVANSFTVQFLKKDSLKNPAVENGKLQQTIFKLHKISKDDFYRSYHYYSSQPEFMMVLLDSMTKKGERDKMKTIQRNMKTPDPVK